MIDRLVNQKPTIDVGSRKAPASTSSSSSASSSSSVQSASAAQVSPDIVEISAGATPSAQPPIDRAKIESIRNAIRNNSYPVDYEKLADRMIESLPGTRR